MTSILYKLKYFVPAGQQQEGNLSVVAMALSGFTEDNTLWRQLCREEKSQLENPYLQTMFAFLTTDPEHYEDMLVS